MKAIAFLAKIILHCCLPICTFHALEYNPGFFFIQGQRLDKRQTPQCPCLYKLCILQFPAHGHQLLIQLLHPFFIKLARDFGCHICKFILFPLCIKHLSAAFHFILSDFMTNLHPLFEQTHHLIVDLIQLFSQFL